MNLKDFTSKNHPYYGTGTIAHYYETFSEFYEEMKDYGVDRNLCYRWDISHKEGEDSEGNVVVLENVTARIFTIQQRKGRIAEHIILSFTEEDVPFFLEYIKPHIEMIKEMWLPLKLG